jgi:hypothetical protein
VKRSRTVPTQRTGDGEGAKTTKRRGKRLDTLASIGSTAESTVAVVGEGEKQREKGPVRQKSKEREKLKEKEGEESRHAQAPAAVESAVRDKTA